MAYAAVFRLLHSYTIGYVGMELARRSVDPARYEAFEARRYRREPRSPPTSGRSERPSSRPGSTSS
jgi:hypothetical protein